MEALRHYNPSAAIQNASLPHRSFLNAYKDEADYCDCLTIEVDGHVLLTDYIYAFYSSPAFKPERILLSVLLRMPSTGQDIVNLARGDTVRFAAWHVEQRSTTQILLCDFQKRSRSWLMIMPLSSGIAPNELPYTRLYFGTVIMPTEKTRIGRYIAKAITWSLTWCHMLYARLLLSTAAKRID